VSAAAPSRVAGSETRDEWARISRVATKLRAQKLALAFDGDEASGWAASVLEATAQPGVLGVVGFGATRAEAAEDAWRRHVVSNPDSEWQARLERAAKNEQSFQSYNARRAVIEESGGTPDDEAVPFVCECDQPKCWRAIKVPLEEYERAVEAPDRFVVVPGHEDPAVEVVLEIRINYLIVSKPDLRRRR
jgi:hypothetical protein